MDNWIHRLASSAAAAATTATTIDGPGQGGSGRTSGPSSCPTRQSNPPARGNSTFTCRHPCPRRPC
jgi:hypothetical protein